LLVVQVPGWVLELARVLEQGQVLEQRKQP